MSTKNHPSKSGNPSSLNVVVGFGNLLLKDEGIGIHLIQSLQKLSFEENGRLMILDGGTCPDILCLLPEGVGKLIIVDAVKGGGKPGDIYRFTPNDFTFSKGIFTSVHQIGLAESLKGLELIGVHPSEIIIIGVEPKEVDWGFEISPELKEIFPQVIDILVNEVHNENSIRSTPI